MKKAALLLGSLLVVGATVSAKEVAPAPVVQQEPQIVEVVVIKEAPKVWRPTGFANLSYKYFGENEYGSADFGRAQLEGAVNLTPQQDLQWRVRSYNSFKHYNTHTNANLYNVGDYGDYSDVRFRYHYKQGTLGDTKISLTHRLEYRTFEGHGTRVENVVDDAGAAADAFGYGNSEQRAEYMARFQFAPYFDWTPEWFKNSNFTLAPRYRYSWKNNNSNYANTLGIDLYTNFDMPYGFSTEVNLYPKWIDYGTKGTANKWDLAVEAYLYWGYNLLQDGSWTLKAQFEGGFDPYSTAGKKFSNLGDKDNSTYSLYALPNLKLSYKATEFVDIYLVGGAEYRNWDYTATKSARQWSWMPQATAGFNVKF